MIPLTERLRILELETSPHSFLHGDRVTILNKGLDDLVDISNDAIRRRNYHALGRIDTLSSRIASRCISLLEKSPDLVMKAILICKVEPEDATDLIVRLHNNKSAEQHPDLIEALVSNIIGHETFFSSARPRVCKDLIEDFIRYTPLPGPAIRLCTAIAHTNTKDVSGASFVLSAIASAEKLSLQATEEARKWPGQTNGYQDKTSMLSAVDSWLRASEVSISESIRDGAPGEWVSILAAEVAAAKELPMIHANLLGRMDMLPFPKLSALAKDSGFFTDQRQMEAVIDAQDANDIAQRSSVIAYCLLYKDILPDSIFSGDFTSAFARAAGLMEKEPLHHVHGKSILERMVENLSPKDDISPLMKSSLHKELISFRKYRGMMIENELGI